MAKVAVLKEVTVTLRMAPDMELEACEKASAVAESMSMSPDKIDEVKMAVIEACLNACEHSKAERREIEASLFRQLNEHIVDSSSPNKFITLILVELDPASGALRSLNAGYNPGLLVPTEGEVVELTAGGMLLGLRTGATYDSFHLQMNGGDLLCLYSDGITECEAPDEEEFGLDRLRELLCESRELPLDEILEKIEVATTGFAAGQPQGDDQMVVLLRRSL